MPACTVSAGLPLLACCSKFDLIRSTVQSGHAMETAESHADGHVRHCLWPVWTLFSTNQRAVTYAAIGRPIRDALVLGEGFNWAQTVANHRFSAPPGDSDDG
jgi:hypothetical protein